MQSQLLGEWPGLGALVSPGWEFKGLAAWVIPTGPLDPGWVLVGISVDSFPISGTARPFGSALYTAFNYHKIWINTELSKNPSKEDAPFSSVPLGSGQHGNLPILRVWDNTCPAPFSSCV